MKTFKITLALLAIALTTSFQVKADARVQVIHNSSDKAAQVVDVWLDNTLLIDDFEFRTATPFVDAPSGAEFTISIKGPKSTDSSNPIWSQNYILEDGKTYILVANGIVPSSSNENERNFDIFVYDMGREEASMTGYTDVLVFHGALGAPTVDVVEIGKGAGTIIDDFAYGAFAGYLELPTDDYILDIRDQMGESSVVSYSVPLATLGLENFALVTVASGSIYVDTPDEEFGLWAALPSGGDLVQLPVFEPGSASVQVIHNSADVAAATVDVWVNESLLLDNFNFRTASPFVDVPTGINLTIGVKGPDSSTPDNPIWSNNYVLEDGKTYILIANGIVSPNGYDPVKPFDIYVYDMGREEASMMDQTDVLVFHGSTDAPTVDVVEIGAGAGTIVDNLMYGDYAGYLELPTADYILDIRDETGENSVVSYAAPLETLGLKGAALVTVASGFLNPGNNSNGEPFGLWVALPSGGNLIDLPVYESKTDGSVNQTARVQVIHNSADAAAASVDVWLNDTKLLDNFAFRTATPFIDAPAGVLLNIGIAPPNSTSWTQSFSIKQVVLTENQTYVVVANGIVSTSGYNPSPAFNVNVYPIGREVASQTGNTDVLIVHGATDAPTVDIYETGFGTGLIADDLTYDNVAGYFELETLDYIIEVRDETGNSTVASYEAPLATLGLEGAALSVMASGFLNPANNSNGEAFGLFVALADGGDLIPLPLVEPQQTARVQVIHNSADAAAAVVDVWLDNTLLLDDFAFRTASPFVDAPADTEFTVAIKGPDSTTPDDPIWSQNYTLAAGETYILVAEGIVSPSGYDPAVPFDIAVYGMGRETANMMDMTDVLVHHGSTDAPTVDVYETGVGAGEIVNDLMYADFAGYLELGTLDYILEIRDETGMNTVAAYQAPLATLGLEGAALTVVASGFLNPANNSNGPAFGLWVALASGGDLVELPVYEMPETARVQVIHNSADAAAAVVDVWLDDILLLDDFAFRTASPFVDAPAGTEFTVAIKGPNSTTPDDPIWSQNYTLAAGETYILVAEGIVSPSGYDPAVPFDIAVFGMGRETANMMDMTDVLVHHGSTDAPTVDVYETGVGAGQIVDNLMYADFAGYLELGTLDYILEIRDETGMNTVAAYQAPLATLGLEGAALTVVASGFLNPANNSNGPAFGLWVALASGGDLVELPVYEMPGTARVQVIHNSADAAAAVVDVWLDDILLLDDFAFRTASPFVDAPAGMEFTIAIKGPDSTTPDNPIWSQNYTLEDGETYILIANGIVSESGYDPTEPFNIYVYDMAREAATSNDNTDVLVFHGATDAPTVDVVEVGAGAGTIVDNLMYGDFAGYLELGTAYYRLAIKDETGETTVATYDAPLADLNLNGAAITVVASGFLTPENNSNGESFGLWVALASGGALVELPLWLSVREIIVDSNVNAYPNPAANFLNIQYSLIEDSDVNIQVYDVLGNKVLEQQLGSRSNQMNNHRIDVSGLNGGLYFVTVNAGESRVTKKIQVVN